MELVSFAAVFRLVTQRSSPQTAAFFRTTFLSLCWSVQAIDQSYHNDCLQSNQSNCSKKTLPRICESGMLISSNLFVVFTAQYLSWDSPPFSLIRDFGKQNTRGNVSKISDSLKEPRRTGQIFVYFAKKSVTSYQVRPMNIRSTKFCQSYWILSKHASEQEKFLSGVKSDRFVNLHAMIWREMSITEIWSPSLVGVLKSEAR